MKVQLVDSHQHLWDLRKFKLPWVDSIPTLNRSFLLSDYEQYTAANHESEFEYEIAQSLYMEVDVAEEDLFKEIDWCLKLCDDPAISLNGMIAATRPGSPLFAKSIEYAKSYPQIKGFRRVLHVDETPTGLCLQPDFVRDIQMLGELDLPFDICIRRTELGDAKKLAEECPNTRFVLDHCGNADVRITPAEYEEWQMDLASIAECPNVVCKVSGFVWTIQNEDWTYEKSIEPVLQVVCDSFGEDRLIFGGDWPVCTLSILSFQQWLNALFRFATQQGGELVNKLFSENAARIYRL